MDHPERDLIAYYFGTVDDQARAAIDAHLCECGRCLRAFLALKREIELGAAPAGEELVPSEATRRRLRETVARRFRPSWPARIAASLRRPVPLYQGLTVALVALVLAVLAPTLWRGIAHLRARSQPPTETGVFVDTARDRAETGNIF